MDDKVDYVGVDINPYFLENLEEEPIEVLRRDVKKDKLPPADFVIMQSSLYQFIPEHKKILDKLLDSSLEKVIISEPVKNLANSNNPIVSFFAKKLSNPGMGNMPFRFTEETFRKFLEDSYRDRIEKFEFMPGGREIMAVLKAS